MSLSIPALAECRIHAKKMFLLQRSIRELSTAVNDTTDQQCVWLPVVVPALAAANDILVAAHHRVPGASVSGVAHVLHPYSCRYACSSSTTDQLGLPCLD